MRQFQDGQSAPKLRCDPILKRETKLCGVVKMSVWFADERPGSGRSGGGRHAAAQDRTHDGAAAASTAALPLDADRHRGAKPAASQLCPTPVSAAPRLLRRKIKKPYG